MKAITKTKVILLLLLAGGMTMQAQDYIPVVQKGNEWHTFETAIHWINNYVNWCSGDTLIGDVRYMKIMGTLNNGNPNLFTVLREEDGKVWKRHLNTSEETLLYDFTANVGDTLTIGDFGQRLIVDSIGTVQIGNADRKKFWLRLQSNNPGGYQFTETWVEGIGSDYGLLWSGYLSIPDGWHCLLCFHQNGELVWENPEYGFCTYTAVEETKDSRISVYPNPAKDKVVIEGLEACCVQVYNALGQLVKQVQDTNEISVAGLPEGVYLLKVTEADGTNRICRVVAGR
ncbi:MAG: T9SS type A sorting domain-containing protein [Bacteroidales bacterium]|nr:T9SS type A sorting domain-containing protein [Bacteroidales bacterium]